MTPPRSPKAPAPRRRPSKPARRKGDGDVGWINLWGLEIGGFRLKWPPIGWKAAVAILAGLVLAVALAAVLLFALKIRPASNDARDAMRRGDYARAAAALSALSPRWEWWPGVADALEQAQFGVRLRSEHVRGLSPELERLRARQPDGVNVLVFQGLSAYYVDGDADRALQFFTRAAEGDPEHVEAHVLAAGRRADRAHDALLRGDDVQARGDVGDAQALLDRLGKTVAFAPTLPSVASQRAELLELGGAFDRAYDTYERLSSSGALFAVQAAMVSWRLPESDSRIRRGHESAQSALARLESTAGATDDTAGWLFRVRGTETVILRDKVDKMCLASRVVEISQALAEGGRAGAAASEHCPRAARAVAIRDVVCVQLLGALAAADPAANTSRRQILEAWRTDRIHCAADLKAPPVLPPAGASPPRPSA